MNPAGPISAQLNAMPAASQPSAGQSGGPASSASARHRPANASMHSPAPSYARSATSGVA
jgi:hypothetical protein